MKDLYTIICTKLLIYLLGFHLTWTIYMYLHHDIFYIVLSKTQVLNAFKDM